MPASAKFNHLLGSLRLPVSKGTASVLAITAAITVLAALKARISRKRKRARREIERFALVEGLEKDAEFDVIVVGGGTAGCVLAARLSEDPNLKVVVIEAGRSGLANEFTHIPGAGFRVLRSKDDYSLYTTEQQNAGGRKWYWPRAKLLGGCSCINAMIFHEGAPSDYDEWATIIGDEGWAYRNFSKYLLKFENFITSDAHPDVDTSKRGKGGPVEVGFFAHHSPLARAFVGVCTALGIPGRSDFNTEEGTIGAGRVLTYIDHTGTRVTTESSYLTPAVRKRKNLTVLTHAQATCLLLEDDGEGESWEEGKTKRAIGVEVFVGGGKEGQGGRKIVLKSRREVVLTAGAVHTPHLLLLSGIGPQSSASPVTITHPLPGVGAHLSDHASVFMRFRCAPRQSLNFLKPRSFGEGMRLMKALVEYKIRGTGALANNVCDAAAFVRSDDPSLFPPSKAEEAETEDPTSSLTAPDLELLSSALGWADHGFGEVPQGDLCSIGITALRPTSRGSITLKSADPLDAPDIDPNYFSSQNDISVLVRGLKLALRLTRTQPYASLLDPNCNDEFLDYGRYDATDAELEQIVRERAETLYHPACSARMAPLAEGGVVDASLRVYGVKGLRIADASVFPKIVSGHTTAPVIAIAEKAADLIKGELLGEKK
ncbi:alcohol oxidase [Schizopora paradoxa]|uniref:Alcohol oxidase n=1 Tax=Schizopora paradoxa TaxID=27342 RepID=A0A0H2R992_9AGAM|nr:alcohol oxidase [Schizopora paradoxa]